MAFTGVRIDLKHNNGGMRGTGGANVSAVGSYLRQLFQDSTLTPEKLRIINTVPYFMKLERGLSSQAPYGIFSDPDVRREIKQIVEKRLWEAIQDGMTQDMLHDAMQQAAYEILGVLMRVTPVDTSPRADEVRARDSYEVDQ